MEKLEDIINVLTHDDIYYSMGYYFVGNDEILENYKNDEYYFGTAYKSKDGSIAIYRFMLSEDNDYGDDWGYSDLEEWLAIGLTEDELEYVMDTVRQIKTK